MNWSLLFQSYGAVFTNVQVLLMTLIGAMGGLGAFFGGNGLAQLEVITYHALAIGFIASTFRTSDNAFSRKRRVEIFNTGVTTVSSYLLQGILGLGLTLIASATVLTTLFPAAGISSGIGAVLFRRRVSSTKQFFAIAHSQVTSSDSFRNAADLEKARKKVSCVISSALCRSPDSVMT